MSATRDGKMWRCQFYYKDWQGVSHKKNKRGFKTKAEAEQWERDFLQQQQRNLDINFENFVQIYYEDMEHRLRENTMRTNLEKEIRLRNRELYYIGGLICLIRYLTKKK
mgnify:CR=1 FL=1